MPSILPSASSDVPILSNITSFNTTNMVTVNGGSTEIDLNKYMLADNTFDGNYIPSGYPLVNFVNVYKVSMSNEQYINNSPTYKEVLNMFGSITSDPDLNTAESGAFKFSGYFLQDEGVSQLSSDDKWYAYSGPPVQLQ